MRIIAIDDEPLALKMLLKLLREAEPEAVICGFDDTEELLENAKEERPDCAFLDIQIYGESGLDLAKKLKEMHPNLNIIFVTAYDEYMGDAFKLHASGYITKPITLAQIQEELANLRHKVQEQEEALVKIVCFGNFEVFDQTGQIVKFSRRRAKEAFAYLVSLNGCSCTVGELGAILFEDECGSDQNKSYVQKILSTLISDIKNAGLQGVVRKTYNSLAIDVSKVDCDYYRYLNGEEQIRSKFTGTFMNQYSWAEGMLQD